MNLVISAAVATGIFDGGGGGPAGPLTVNLAASRTSGPAPLAVFFDAVGSTHTDGAIDTFRQVGYSFNFGDPGSGNWATTGQSKNIERGAPLAAHVFQTPGSYTVKVRGRDLAGNTDQKSVVITVTDPNTTFSGTNTVCLSLTGDFTGAPAGAAQQVISSWPVFQSNRRYLLRAGQNFSSLGTLHIKQISDVQIGKFGSGANPIVSTVNVENGDPENTNSSNYPNGYSNWAERIVVMDITSSSTGTSMGDSNSSTDVLWLRCTSANGFRTSGTVFFYYNNSAAPVQNSLYFPVNQFFVECTSQSPTQNMNFEGTARNFAILGCNAIDPTEHNVRVFGGKQVLVAHNRLGQITDSLRHNIKMHSNGPIAWNDFPSNTSGGQHASRYARLAWNDIGDSPSVNTQGIQVGPQSGDSSIDYQEGVEDVMIENNTYRSNNSSAEIVLDGRRLTHRSNTVTGGTLTVSTSTGKISGVPGGDGGPWDGPYNADGPMTFADPT